MDDLVERFGSPLYTYDLDEAERRADELLGLLPERSTLFYSLKANPLLPVVATMIRRGCGAEVSSVGELRVALEAGCPASRILYTGPGKGLGEIRAAIAARVTRFSVESWADLDRVGAAARAVGVVAQCLLRVNPTSLPRARLPMTGVASEFGFEEADLLAGAARFQDLGPEREIFGVHVYSGTQVESPDAIAANVRDAIRVAEVVSDALGLRLKAVDVGGGFPWPYARDGAGADLGGLRERLAEVSAERRSTATAQLWFESGRYLSASSGTLLATVVDVKASKGRKYIVLDTGIHHLGGMSGLGRLPRPAVVFRAVGAAVDPEKSEVVNIVGPLCSPLDCLARAISMPRLRIGDLVRIPNVGAYGLTASLSNFTSRTPPLEIAHRSGVPVGIYRLREGHGRLDHRPSAADDQAEYLDDCHYRVLKP